MKALPKRKGNQVYGCESGRLPHASMKALPKRKGNEDGLGFYFGKCTRPQ